MARLGRFELHAGDPQGAAAFYANVFGWSIAPPDADEERWRIATGVAGLDGGIVQAQDRGLHAALWIEVESVSMSLAEVVGHGGEVVRPMMRVKGGAVDALFTDPAGNVVGMYQRAAGGD